MVTHHNRYSKVSEASPDISECARYPNQPGKMFKGIGAFTEEMVPQQVASAVAPFQST